MKLRSFSQSSSISAILICLFLSLFASGRAALTQQTSSTPSQKPQTSPPPQPPGMATGGAHAPVKDSRSRPITAGGFVDGAPIIFLDITRQSGLDKFRHRSGTPEKSTIAAP